MLDAFGDDPYAVLDHENAGRRHSLGPRMRCEQCGQLSADNYLLTMETHDAHIPRD